MSLRQFAMPGCIALTLAIAGCGVFGNAPVTVDSVEITRYAGRWYEIARYPNFFEQGCVGVTADYGIRDDGLVSVVNTCRVDDLDGPTEVIEGTARTVDDTGAKLKVRFFGPFEGDYWIIDLGEEYEYAVVSDPARLFLWILSRTPQMDADVYEGITARLAEQGFDLDRLILVEQFANESIDDL